MFHRHYGNTNININYGDIPNATHYDYQNAFNANTNCFNQYQSNQQNGQTVNGYHNITVNDMKQNVLNSRCTPNAYHNITVNGIEYNNEKKNNGHNTYSFALITQNNYNTAAISNTSFNSTSTNTLQHQVIANINDNDISKINVWGRKRIAVPIGNNICIRFPKDGISLGVRYYKTIESPNGDVKNKQMQKFGLSADQLIDHINTLSIPQRNTFINTFKNTMTVDFIKVHFKHWKDVQDNIEWQNTVDLFLHKLQNDILQAINSKRLTKTGNYVKSLENSNQILQTKVTKLYEQKKQYINESHSQTVTIQNKNNQLNIQSRQLQLEQQQNSQLRKDNRQFQIQNNRQRHQINRLQQNQMLIPRSDLSNCARPKQVEKYRIAQNFSKTARQRSAQNQSELLTEYVHNNYPQYHQKQQEQKTQTICNELKDMEKRNAKEQFEGDIQSNMTQRQQRKQRQYLFQSKNKRHETSDGIITAGVSTPYSKSKEQNLFIDSLVEDGTAFYPLILKDGKLVYYDYDKYYDDMKQTKKDQKDPTKKKDRRPEKKKGPNNCGPAYGTTRDIKNALDKKIALLITHPNGKIICKFHESNFQDNSEHTINFPFIPLFVTFDGAGVKKSRAGNDHTQVHILFGGLHDCFAGYVNS